MELPIPHFAVNDVGTDYIVGDLHGCLGSLMQALDDYQFDPMCDRLFSVGDLIDRGPDSLGCLRLLREPWFFPVLGNHEQMMIENHAREDNALWFCNGGSWYAYLTLEEREEADSLKSLLRSLPRRITVEDSIGNKIGICHAQPAGPIFCGPMGYEDEQELIWGRSVIQGNRPYAMEDVAFTVHGHTPLDRITSIGRHLFIDTGAVFGGSLSVVRVNSVAHMIPAA